MTLTPEEIERYKRHLVLREVGGQGQQKLKAAKVLVDRRRRPRLAAAHVSGRCRRRHARHHRRRSRLARQPAAPDRARHAPRRCHQGRERAGDHRQAQSARASRGPSGAHRRRQRARPHRPLRHRRRRLRQFRHPLPGERRLLSGQAHAGVCRRRPVRRLRHDLQAARARPRRRALSLLPLHFPGAAAARHGGQLRRGRRAGRCRRRHRHLAGDRGAEGDRAASARAWPAGCCSGMRGRPASPTSRSPGTPTTRCRASRRPSAIFRSMPVGSQARCARPDGPTSRGGGKWRSAASCSTRTAPSSTTGAPGCRSTARSRSTLRAATRRSPTSCCSWAGTIPPATA